VVRRVTTRRVRSVGLLVLIAGLALGGCSSSNREAGNLGTRVCIVNESSRAATVVFTKRDTARGEGSVAPGYQACGEGTFFAGDDVKGTITLASPLIEMKVTAINPWTGPPQATVYVNGWGCLDDQFWKEGDKDVWDDGVLLYTVQRLADGQWKEFTVTLAESEKPSESGLPTHCVPDSGTGFS
jgi:hypothetical protein